MTPAGYTATETPTRYTLRCDGCGERSGAQRTADCPANGWRALTALVRRWAKLHDTVSDCAGGRAVVAQRGA